MVEVRIRHDLDAKAVHLADVPFDQLDTVIPTLKDWGVVDYEDHGLSGSFVYEDGAAYFEVLISSEDDG